MIDLHIQTSLADGYMSVYRVLETIKDSDVSYFSIVDANHAFAYDLIDKDLYPKLITGTNIRTILNDRPIDLIGYDIDTDVINKWYEEVYAIEEIVRIENCISFDLIKSLADNNYIVDVEDVEYYKLGQAINDIFNRTISKYPDFVYDNARDFRIYGVNNPNSKFYVEQKDFYPSLDDAIDLIRGAGGKVFLAHPFDYRGDVSEFLEMVIDKDLDGVEAFHSTSSIINSLKLVEFCEAAKKMASIGSGFVGNEEFIPIGIPVEDAVLEKDCFKWIFDR